MFGFSTNTINEKNLDNRNIRINTRLPVYITMSTIPSRFQNTIVIIKNFLAHVSGFEKIILNVPRKYKRWPNHVPDYRNNIRDSRFYLNVIEEDQGPVTKFLPALDLVPDESILIVRDDMCYKLDAFKDIAELQDRRLFEAFSYYVYQYNGKTDDNKVGVPQGADLISMYSKNAKPFKSWFESIKDKLNLKNYFDTPCFFVDDQVIGWYFQYHGIPMRQVETKHRNIYIQNCDNAPEHDNLNRQTGKNSRENTMDGCYADLMNIFPL
jgi:heat shock protein HspQ